MHWGIFMAFWRIEPFVFMPCLLHNLMIKFQTSCVHLLGSDLCCAPYFGFLSPGEVAGGSQKCINSMCSCQRGSAEALSTGRPSFLMKCFRAVFHNGLSPCSLLEKAEWFLCSSLGKAGGVPKGTTTNPMRM